MFFGALSLGYTIHTDTLGTVGEGELLSLSLSPALPWLAGGPGCPICSPLEEVGGFASFADLQPLPFPLA